MNAFIYTERYTLHVHILCLYLRIKLFRLVSRWYILTSSWCAASLCILTSLWLARYTLVYLIMIKQKSVWLEKHDTLAKKS